MKKTLLFLSMGSAMAADNLTIYNRDLALVSEQHSLDLQAGTNKIDLANVAARIIPQSAILKSAAPFQLLEQNFDYDLLNGQSLLDKYVGKEIEVIFMDGQREKATVLANNGNKAGGEGEGPILKYADRIEIGLPHRARLAFPGVPDNLRDKPTLNVQLDSKEAQKAEVELSYLTQGMDWRADYVANLAKDDKLSMAGWVTLNNQSGKTFDQARIQLVAGEVNRAPVAEFKNERMLDRGYMPIAAAAAEAVQEVLGDYHLYTLPNLTSVLNNQSKQVALLSVANIPVEKIYELNHDAMNDYEDEFKQQAKTYLKFTNKEMPLPEGIVRVYQQDSQGQSQFVGEDRIKHTATDEEVKLTLGEAFDVRGEYKRKDWRRLDTGLTSKERFQVEEEITLFNSRDQAVQVAVIERFNGQWEIKEESAKHEKKSATEARWLVEVPAKGKSVLSYKAELTY